MSNWSYGLFDCYAHWKICCCVTCCPCADLCATSVAVANAERNDPNAGCKACLWIHVCNAVHCSAIGHAVNRTKIRKSYNIQGSCLVDYFILCCCMPCALTQEWREVMKREHQDDQRNLWQAK